jgi:excisionase family DNA binding protein
MPAYLTTKEVAELLAVDIGKVCDWIANGDLPAVNVALVSGGVKPRWRISRESFDQSLARRQSNQPVTAPRKKREVSGTAYY